MLNADSALLAASSLVGKESSKNAESDPEVEIMNYIVHSPLLRATEYETTPKDCTNFLHLAEEMAALQLNQSDLLAPLHEALLFSPDPVVTSSPATEDSMPLYVTSLNYPIMESLDGNNQPTTQSLESRYSPPPAPRPALVILPELDTKPLTLMYNLLQVSSLSHEQSFHRDNDPPSSSPFDGMFRSSSPPNSSPSQIFSSSLPNSSPLLPHIDREQSISPVSLHRPNPLHEQHSDYPVSVIPWNTQTTPSSSPLAQSNSPPIPGKIQSTYDNYNKSIQSGNKVCINPTLMRLDESSSFDYAHAEPQDAFLALQPSTTSSNPSSSPMAASPFSPWILLAHSSPQRGDGEEEGSRSMPGSEGRSVRATSTMNRGTLVSQRRQHNKLSTPFKSPLIVKKPSLNTQEVRIALPSAVDELKNSTAALDFPAPISLSSSNKPDPKQEDFSARAAVQFNSPLSSSSRLEAATNIDSATSQLRLTPTMQTLERKTQVLKRALKLEKEKEKEEVLTDLATRWTEAGREVAWEVWELTTDREASWDGLSGPAFGGRRSFEASWGWDTRGSEKRVKLEDRGDSWRWDIKSTSAMDETDENAMLQDDNLAGTVEEEDEERVEYTDEVHFVEISK